MMMRAALCSVLCLVGVLNVYAVSCDFPVNLNGWQALGLSKVDGISSADDCAQACCDKGDSCKIWEWVVGEGAGCWVGSASSYHPASSSSNFTSAGRDVPAPPTPLPPLPTKPFVISDDYGLGMEFKGIGAISGGGATSKLLIDYSPDVASDILDFLFKPNFGASLHILKSEVGGDSDATEGAESSHMESPTDLNFQRGYEWFMMTEARKRNPDIKLYGLSWSWPSWLGEGGTPDKAATNPFTNITNTVTYSTNFLKGAKSEWGLQMDYIGLWNERSAPSDYRDALTAALAADPELEHVEIGEGPHYPGTSLEAQSDCTVKYPWNSTHWVDEEGSVADGQSARCLARCINREYLTGCFNGMIQWHLVSSFADYLPWKRCGVAVANTPWSGFYEVTSPTWAIAHTTQFSQPGWRYLRIGAGVGFLKSGGSYTTRTNGKGDYSIVVEKMTQEDSHCARGNNPAYPTAAEVVTFTLGGGLAKVSSMHIWFSDLTDGNNSTQLFVYKGTIDTSKGTLTVTMLPNQIYTFTTLATGNKGSHPVPSPSAFPVPYSDDFESAKLNAPGKFFYQQMGSWVVESGSGGHSQVYRQISPSFPVCWGYDCEPPHVFFGDASFNTASFSVDAYPETDVGVSLSFEPKGNTFLVDTNGTWSFGHQSGKVSFPVASWHTMKIAQDGDGYQQAYFDGTLVANVSAHVDNWYLKMGVSRFVGVQFDNVALSPM